MTKLIKENCRIYRKRYNDTHKLENNVRSRKYYVDHVEERKIYRKKYNNAHKVENRLRAIRYKNAHIEKYGVYAKKYNAAHKGKILIYQRKANSKYRQTIAGQLHHRMSTAICIALNKNKHGRRWETLVGYTAKDLRKHLETQFTKGMTWGNMGQWHIDHIIPLSHLYFDGTDDPTFKFAWSLGNLQPLWAVDNMKKSNKIGKAA